MRFRSLLVAVLFMLFPGVLAQSSQAYDIYQHTISIVIDDAGNARITEQFFLSFPQQFYLNQFKSASAENGINLIAWKRFDSRIHTYIGNERDLVNAQVSFIESNESYYLELTYSLSKPIMYVTTDTTRMVEYTLKENTFREFLVGPLWIIPDNTTIRLTLPKKAEIQGQVKPDARIQGNTITFQGYKSSNILEVRYRVWKQIASFDLQSTIQELLNSELAVFFGGLLFIVVVLGYVKRKAISDRVENYIVEHTEIAPSEDIPE